MTIVVLRLRRRIQTRILRTLKVITERLHERWEGPVKMPTPVQGKLLAFIPIGSNLGRAVLSVKSTRGGFVMGTIEWSNQWNRPRFKADSEGVFDQQCIAEIYAAMKELK